MIPTTTLFTKTRNRWRHIMQLRSNPDFMQDDFEMFSRVWRSIKTLCLTSGLRKNYAREVGIRTIPQYQISPNFLFWGLFRGGRNRKIAHYAGIRYGRGKDMWFYSQPKYKSLSCILYCAQERMSKRYRIAQLSMINIYRYCCTHFIWHVLPFVYKSTNKYTKLRYNEIHLYWCIHKRWYEKSVIVWYTNSSWCTQ